MQKQVIIEALVNGSTASAKGTGSNVRAAAAKAIRALLLQFKRTRLDASAIKLQMTISSTDNSTS